MPNNPLSPLEAENVRLARAPGNPKEFRDLALQMAEIMKPTADLPVASYRSRYITAPNGTNNPEVNKQVVL
jgi:hypothetical protein